MRLTDHVDQEQVPLQDDERSDRRRPEDWRGQRQDRNAAQAVVEWLVLEDRGNQTYRDRDGEADDHDQDAQLDRVGQRAADLVPDRILGQERGAEVESDGVPKPVRVLFADRQIESEVGLALGDRFRVGAAGVESERGSGEVAGQDPNREKRERADQEDDEDRANDATNDVGLHGRACFALMLESLGQTLRLSSCAW